MAQAKIFTADQFTPTKWDTADVKAKFGNDLIAFVGAGFPESKFTKALYTRLSMTFGHIAHYDRGGFYGTWFDTPAKREQWLVHVRNHHVCGDAHWTYSDVEKAIQRHMRCDEGVQKRIHSEARAWDRASDMGTATLALSRLSRSDRAAVLEALK